MEAFWTVYNVWWFRLLLPLMGLFALGVAIARAIQSPPVQADQLAALIVSGELLVRYLQGAVFALFLMLSRFFHVAVRRYPSGILDGFGIAVAGILAAFFFRSEFGTRFNIFFRFAPSLAYILATIIWLASFLGEEDKLDEAGLPPQQLKGMRGEIGRYNEIARRFWKK
jgi:hypothetical protein